MIKITNLVFFITECCNLKCPYCFETGERKNSMTKEMLDKVIEFYKKNDTLKNTKLEYFGGEPTINKELFIYMFKKYFEDKDIYGQLYSMTNARVLDEDYIKELSEIKNIGLSKYPYKNFMFYVSVDTINNSEKNFEAIKDNILLLKKYGINYTFEVTISPYNYKNLYATVKELYKYVGIDINLRRLCNTSCFTKEQVDTIEKQIMMIIDDNEIDNSKIIFPPKKSNKNEIDPWCSVKQTRERTIYFIDTNGDLYPCEVSLWRKINKLGNIDDDKNISPKKWSIDNKNYTTCLTDGYPGNPFYDQMAKNIEKKIRLKNIDCVEILC